MDTKVGKFSFVIPDGHSQAGDKMEKTFDFRVCQSDTEALAIISEKKWSIASLVNDKVKADARSNAYQSALLPYRPSEVSAEDIQERMVRDYIRLKIPESVARAQVTMLLKAASENAGQ